VITRHIQLTYTCTNIHAREQIPLQEVTMMSFSDSNNVLEVSTAPGGYNSGRLYVLRTVQFNKGNIDARTLAGTLKPLINSAINERAALLTPWSHRQFLLKSFYDTTFLQIIVCLLIAGNFVANVVEKQIRPVKGSDDYTRFENLELSFTIMFACELLLNAAANWWKPFINDGEVLACMVVCVCVCVVCLYVCVFVCVFVHGLHAVSCW
jgi:hypothetical protein